MLTGIIADDNEIERLYFCKLLRETNEVKILAEAPDGLAALDLVTRLRPDIAFLDIEMPGPNGLEVAREILTLAPETFIVFFTAYRDFAVEAFALNSVDYLLKPFDAFRVRKTVAKIQEKLAAREAVKKPGGGRLDKLAIRNKGRIFLINLDEIIFIEKSGKNTTIIHTARKDFYTPQTIGELEQQLAGYSCFQRVHKSYLINLNMIESISPYGGNSFIVKFSDYKKDATISRGKIDIVKQHINIG
ncbi:LytR/AlgR family response regulator transcription factor [Moorella sp. Hama-1]|uniref:LytR/AlgR family response regulator transcription factor n=1 Tax=Moorella sp. Hama-1 TaxID=2138101 RepID=UPI000D645D7C|nr:LytTR family DNA-binding domain-containing protein [Moorella sp. Hama-1]BCV22160.1 DNA-binding response regulator [Moorella sp. Hama-1]